MLSAVRDAPCFMLTTCVRVLYQRPIAASVKHGTLLLRFMAHNWRADRSTPYLTGIGIGGQCGVVPGGGELQGLDANACCANWLG